jgi:hypothetical protein
MRTIRVLFGIGAVTLVAVLASSRVGMGAGQIAGDAVRIDQDDLGGTVTGPKGPEAGVWVIAETMDLPTKFVRIVVTDAQGRYLVPDLPKAGYNVWVRGYGLVDSPKVQSGPGRILNLTAVLAPTARAAADYYPAGHWFSLLGVPDTSEFPGTGPSGNGISANIKSQAEWIRSLGNGGCWGCHQLGRPRQRVRSPRPWAASSPLWRRGSIGFRWDRPAATC